jgi:phosphoglycolate phosphatase
MIGDRSHDMVGAVNNGLVPLGVGWGFGSREELESAGAVAWVEKPQDLTTQIERLSTDMPG